MQPQISLFYFHSFQLTKTHGSKIKYHKKCSDCSSSSQMVIWNLAGVRGNGIIWDFIWVFDTTASISEWWFYSLHSVLMKCDEKTSSFSLIFVWREHYYYFTLQENVWGNLLESLRCAGCVRVARVVRGGCWWTRTGTQPIRRDQRIPPPPSQPARPDHSPV